MYTFYGVSRYKDERSRPLDYGTSAQKGCVTDQTSVATCGPSRRPPTSGIEHVTARLRVAAALDRAVRERIGDAGLDQLYEVLEAVGKISRGKAEFDPANFNRAPNLW